MKMLLFDISDSGAYVLQPSGRFCRGVSYIWVRSGRASLGGNRYRVSRTGSFIFTLVMNKFLHIYAYGIIRSQSLF